MPSARELHADALGDEVDVGAVLDDDAHRAARRPSGRCRRPPAAAARAPSRSTRRSTAASSGPASRTMWTTSTRRRARVSSSSGACRRTISTSRSTVGVVEPEVEAAALQGLGQLARVVGGEDDDGMGARLDHAQLGDRDLEVGEDLEQHRLELLVGLVDLVDQQHDRARARRSPQQRPGEQELLAEDVAARRIPAGLGLLLGLGLDPQQLLAVVPLVERLGLVEALVALEADQLAAGGARDAPSRARSCRPRPGPRPARACPAAARGRRRGRRIRPPDSPTSARPPRTSATELIEPDIPADDNAGHARLSRTRRPQLARGAARRCPTWRPTWRCSPRASWSPPGASRPRSRWRSCWGSLLIIGAVLLFQFEANDFSGSNSPF